MEDKYYLTRTIDKVKEFPESWDNFKLCYIDNISETIWDKSPETKKLIKDWTENDWKKWESERWDPRTGQYVSDPRFQYQDYPNPDYIEGKQTKFAYFTSVDMKDQWGDDWDDAPYEHNAGTPYNSICTDELAKEGEEYALTPNKTSKGWRKTRVDYHEILIIPFYVDPNVKEPKDFGDGYNSNFSIADINSGAVAWLYKSKSGKSCNGMSIMAGCSPKEFIDMIEKMNSI